MNALADPKVGDYINRHFVSSFQKVGTFRIVGGQKQGGNLASYMCTPNGGILNAVAGPVDAATLLREARWVVENRKTAILESRSDLKRYKEFFRLAHAERLPNQLGANWRSWPSEQASEAALLTLLDENPAAGQLNQQERINMLLAAYPLVNLDQAYRVVYERIVGEKVSTRPVAEGNAGPDAEASLPLAAKARGQVRQSFYFGPAAPRNAVADQGKQLALLQARGNPPRAQICAAIPLNTLVEHLAGVSNQQATLRSVPLTAELLAHINVAAEGDPTADRNLRGGGRLQWPLIWRAAWLGKLSQERRRSLELLLPKVIVQASNVAGGVVDAGLLTRMRTDLNQLQNLLDAKIDQLTSSEYVEANAYLRELKGTIKILGRTDVARYIGDRPALDPRRIKTVPDLVAYMSEQQLRFTPATAGDESSYMALFRALTQCDKGIERKGENKEVSVDSGDI